MSFGKFKKLLKIKPMIVGLPNPNSVSKEEFQRRVQRLREINSRLNKT